MIIKKVKKIYDKWLTENYSKFKYKPYVGKVASKHFIGSTEWI